MLKRTGDYSRRNIRIHYEKIECSKNYRAHKCKNVTNFLLLISTDFVISSSYILKTERKK